jgi:manganese transport protein
LKLFNDTHAPRLTGLEIFKYIGPGLIVTVGFIDPGNWASNIAAGSDYGYTLLWIVTLGTVMLIVLQHNAAHLGIATGLCLSEAATRHLKPVLSRIILGSAVVASLVTAMAEMLGGALALQMLFRLPIKYGTLIMLAAALWMLFSNSYKKIERWIIGLVSVIGLSFIFEVSLVHVDWLQAAQGLVTPSFPHGSMLIIMSVLGAVVMPHNLFLHSEIIRSREWNLKDDAVIRRQLKYEFSDTLLSMGVGWAINVAMIILAAATFFSHGAVITQVSQADSMLRPLLGNAASIVFAVALLLSGLSSSITAGMAGGSIFSGIFSEPYDITDSHSRMGMLITMIGATVAIFFITDPFMGLIYSQMLLSIQLPVTNFTLIWLTTSEKVMGRFKNSRVGLVTLLVTAIVVLGLNITLFISLLR